MLQEVIRGWAIPEVFPVVPCPPPSHAQGVLEPDGSALTTYLVERYLPGVSAVQLVDAIARAASSTAQMRAGGTMIRYLGSTFIPADEACYCLYTAPSVQAVRTANESGGFAFARIVTAVRYPPEQLRELEEPCER